MRDPRAPVLAYDRICANRRNTLLLLGVFGLVSLPFVVGLSVWVGAFVGIFSLGIAKGALGDDGAIVIFLAFIVAYLAPFCSLIEAGCEGLLDELVGIARYTLPAAILAPVIVAVAGWLQYLLATRLVLRMARARPVERDQEPALWRTVENLCIGAGLPCPRIHVVESRVPNAFAVGLDPERAALGVTRGLLTLLDRRELEAVIAHELSHIGNHDIRLNTVLAALGTALRLPLAILKLLPFVALFWLLGLFPLWAVVMAKMLPPVASAAVVAFYFGLPLYVLVVAPGVGLLLRRAVSRDPEGLALALVTIGAATGEGMRVNAAMAHLYVVDPLPLVAPWWDRMFSTHPHIEERIALLARMGSGISPSALRAAQVAGAAFRQP